MIKGYASSITYAPTANTDPYNGGHHKSWSYKENLANVNGIAYCQHPDFNSDQPLSSTVGLDNYEDSLIPGNNGTLHTPAPLDLKGFTFDFGEDERNVKSIIVHYKQQTFENHGEVIDMGDPTITLLNNNTSKKLNGKVTTTLTERRVTFQNITKSQLLSSNFGIRIAYPKNGSSRTCGRIILQDVYIEVITGDSYRKYPQSIEYYEDCGGNTNYKCWDNLNNLKNSNGTAHCRDPNATETPLIAGVNGTYNQPAPLRLYNFQFDLDPNVPIEKVNVHYKQQTFENNGYYPEIGGATVNLLGTAVTSQKGTGVGSNLTENILTFKGVTPEQLNNNNFGLKLAYPKNVATTPGRIILQDVYVEVFPSIDATKITLDSTWSKNPVLVGETTNLTLTAKKTSTDPYNADIIVDLPYGISLGSITCSDTVTQTTETENGVTFTRLRWKINMVQGSTSSTLTTTVTAQKANNTFSNPTRASQLTMTEQGTNITTRSYLKINPAKVSLSTTLYKNKIALKPDYANEFTVTIKTEDPTHTQKYLRMDFDYPGEVRNVAQIRAVTGVIDVIVRNERSIIIEFTDNGNTNLSIPVKLYYPDGGEFTSYMYVSNTTETTQLASVQTDFIVNPLHQGDLGFTRVLIHKHWAGNMGDGTWYTLGSMIKYIMDGDHAITDFGRNLRIGVYNDSSEYLSDENTFLDRVIWSKIATNTEREAKVDFQYDSNNPLYVVYSHTYTGDPLARYLTFSFSNISIVESSVYDTSILREWSLQPISALLGDTSYARARMNNTGYTSYTQPAICYDWDDGGLFQQDISPLGFTISFDYIVDETVRVEVELYLDDEHLGNRSVLLSSSYGTASVGNSYDLFGMQISDFIGKLNRLQVRLSVFNEYDKTATIEINNVNICMMYVNRTYCKYGFIIDGINSNDLGIVVTDVEYPFATQNEKSIYRVTGTDNTIVNRLNVDAKEVKVRLGIPGCDMKDNIYLIDKIVELFTNERELNSNKPILKRIIFNHMPDREFRFVREKEFDDEWIGGSYKATITLYIPDGTTYDVNKTVTGSEGYVPTSIALKPDITLKVTTKGTIRLSETYLNQVMIINTQVNEGDIIFIDTENRTVTNITQDKDLSASLDYNSTWFKIKGEYNFECDNGSILSVEYYLRR